MRIAGLILSIFGILILLIGLGVCVVTLTSDYASSACARAVADESKLAEAKRKCANSSEYLKDNCLNREASGLTSQEECDDRRSYMTKQLIMGIVPAVIGGLLAVIGLVAIIAGRKKALT